VIVVVVVEMREGGGGGEEQWCRIKSGIESIARSAAAAMEVNNNNRYKIDMNSGDNDDGQWRFRR